MLPISDESSRFLGSKMLPRMAAVVLAVACLTAIPAIEAFGNGGVVFTNIAEDPESGLVYGRTPSESIAVFDALSQVELLTPDLWGGSPSKPHGAPGVALIDFDHDGDLDIYVTNGPGSPNSLFRSLLVETGEMAFADIAAAAGVEATDQDSSGVCAGDIDNDGDADLAVLSNFGANRLYENLGIGEDGIVTFADISAESGFGEEVRSSVGCSFGDIDNDGLLDLAVGNTYIDMSNLTGIGVPFMFDQHNQIYRNTGGNVFVDISAEAGIEGTVSIPEGFEGLPTLTWALALVDIDQDGDVDLIHADDQGGIPIAALGGVDRFIHFFENDGTGHFTDRSLASGIAQTGAWMGLSFGDLDGDGDLDLYGSNLGDYVTTVITELDPVYGAVQVYELGSLASRWFLNEGPGDAGHATFSDPGVGSLVATTFGWGTSMADYDNDADLDIVMHGGLYFPLVLHGSPGAIMQNLGGDFDGDRAALASSTDHDTRNVQGVAMGDLDGNGFDDIVTVANFDIPIEDMSIYNHNYGGPFDGGRYTQLFTPVDGIPASGVWGGIELKPGSLAVELSSGDNGNRWAKIKTQGSVGIVPGATANRDGIGAVVSFRTARGLRTARPVLGGSSYASQDALELTFGMGPARRAIAEVVWPGGVRNRFYGVRAGESVLLPEIPCDFTADWDSIFDYAVCVFSALGDLEDAGVVNERKSARLFAGALRAFLDQRVGSVAP